MNLISSIGMAFSSLSANKMRSILTMLGIIIGTGAVIALLSVGQGAQGAITEQIQSIGSNLIFGFPGRYDQSSSQQVRNWAPLTRQDAEALADPSLVEHVSAVAPVIQRSASVTYGGDSYTTPIIGTTPEFEFVRNYTPEFGQFFTEGEDAAAARVALLGYQTASDFFGNPADAVGETVRINNVPFEVIGVFEKKGGQGFGGGGSQDSLVIIPLTTAQRRLFTGRFLSTVGESVDGINVSAVDEESIEAAIDEITWLLRERHDVQYEEDDFTVASQSDILGVFDQIMSVFTIFLGAIAAISLLVGGIGIMNIMLVSVTERTREIGIRKAVGARRSDILWQFLIESMVLSIVGGAIGIGFGWAVAAVVNTLDAFVTYVSPQAIMIAVSSSLIIGLCFGVYPASRAANLNPIQALRYE